MERVFNAIYGEQSQETKKQLAMMGYKAEEQAEEGIIRSFEECFLNETLRKKVERGLKPKEGISEDAMLAVNTINNIVNFIKYGREGKRTTESGRGTVGDITQQSAKENGTGRDVEVRNSEGASKTQRRDAKANRGEITEQDDDVLFRSDSELAIENYNKRVLESSYQAQEALQDSMLALKEAQEAIVKETGKAIRDEDEMEENMTTYPKTANLMESIKQSTGFFCITPQVRRVSKQQKEQEY